MKECTICHCCFPDHINHCPFDGHENIQSLIGDPVLDGRYQLEKRLGQGGMGIVYKAHHVFLKTPHAIKVILPELVGNDPTLATRFRQEAMAAAAIRHPNIISVTDYGVIKGMMPFLVMEFVQGRSLHELLEAEGKLSPLRALEFMMVIASGVNAAHQHGIVHRDLKPLNIMLQDNKPITEAVKILDFGLAKIKSGELLGSFVLAQTIGMMGSPHYMAPEQWSDGELDQRSDIYSLGIILFQMLAGDVPFKGVSMPTIMKKHLMDPPPHFSELNMAVPPAIEQVVHHALEKDPNKRPATTEEFINELRHAVITSAAMDRARVVERNDDFEITAQHLSAEQRAAKQAEGSYLEETRSSEVEAARSRLQEEARQRAEEESRQQAKAEKEAEERRRREEEQRRAEEARQAEEEEAARSRAEEERRRQAEAERLRLEEEARLRAEAEAAQKRVAEEARRAAEQEARRRAEEEEARQRVEEEQRRAEEAARLAAEAEAQRKAEEETRQRAEEEAKRRAAEVERKRAEEEARRQAEAETARLRAAEELRRREEEQRQAEEARRQAEEEAQRRAAEEARLRAEEEAARLKAVEEERLRAEAEEKRKAKEEAEQIRAAEERRHLEAEAARKREEEEARRKAEEEERLRAEEFHRQAEAARRRQDEEARQRAEEESRRAAEEAARQQAAEEARRHAEEDRFTVTVASNATIEPPPTHQLTSAPDDFDQTRPGVGVIPPPHAMHPMDATQQSPSNTISQKTANTLPEAQKSWQQFEPPAQTLTSSSDLPAQKKSFPRIYIGAALVALLVGGVGLYFLTRPATDSKQQSPQPAATGEVAKPDGGAKGTNTVPASEMVFIVGGTFLMGRNDGPAEEAPAHSVTVKPFYMGKTEVTNAQYAEFVQATGYLAPSDKEAPYWKPWVDDRPPDGQELWPVRNVSITDAQAYARWLSKRDGVTYRLPTEEEWEFVARNGDSSKLYPWGDRWVNGYANIDSTLPKPVGSYKEGAISTGVYDLIGNVWEWTSSKGAYYPGNKLEISAEARQLSVVRGGSYQSEAHGGKAITATSRSFVEPSYKHPTIGFRLVR
jgi:formylglycine-generating enzyme required for sulfatase activity